MNNTSLIFLIRRDSVLGLAAHLAAGILALVMLTGAAGTGNNNNVSKAKTVSSVVVHR